MKKYRIICILMLVVLIIAGCTSNKESKDSQEQTSEPSNVELIEETDTQTISEHLTDELTNEEIWFEVSVDSPNDISSTAHITILLLTDERYHKTGYGESFGARGLMGDGGYSTFES